uniref:Uncharacterized protein n=1 Tax=Promethearchaeum syntrophicum TaxID=2594042 RepID=A0A5B9D893_9ARCH|nr:hypothetical protein DSAG12_00793 [Candidatus Prometheoarchaeum syntrophicum]
MDLINYYQKPTLKPKKINRFSKKKQRKTDEIHEENYEIP